MRAGAYHAAMVESFRPGEFRRRILLADANEQFVTTCAARLRAEGYEVLTAHDGFAALHVLRGAIPDLLISELELPRMSGFELLSIVRSRFPQISVVATSAEYSPSNLPAGVIADRFVGKGPNTVFELVEAALGLIREAPLRSSPAKPEMAPVWVPRSASGYVVVTCPECLRSSSVGRSHVGTGSVPCVACNASLRVVVNATQEGPALELRTSAQRAQAMSRDSKSAITASGLALSESNHILNRRGRS